MSSITSLISRLRIKMGDNPTRVVNEKDENKTIYVLDSTSQVFVAKIANLSDCGKFCFDTEKVIWTDAEYREQLNSARVILFKGMVKTLEMLTEFEEEALLTVAKIEFLKVLAVDATRYAKYTTVNTQVEKTTPEQFMTMAVSLNKMLRDMLRDGSPDSSIEMDSVTEGIIKRFDRNRGMYVSEKHDTPPIELPFLVTKEATGIRIRMRALFIPDYANHYIAKGVEPNEGTPFANFYRLQDMDFVDTDVISGITYRYTLFMYDVNGNLTKTSQVVMA